MAAIRKVVGFLGTLRRSLAMCARSRFLFGGPGQVH
jgi:hypothetical protein